MSVKCIIFVFAILLNLFCGADSVTITPSQQSWANIISDGNISVGGTDSSNITRTVYVPNPIAFSAQRRSFNHHTMAPRYSLDRMSTEQLIWFFVINNYTQDQILSYPLLYMRSAYLTIVKQLPKYPRYVKMYHDEYKKFNWFTKGIGRMLFIYTPKLQQQFAMLWQECEEQRIAQEKREQEQRELRTQQEREVRERKEVEERAAYIRELERVERILSDGSPVKRISTDNYRKRLEKIQAAQQHPERKLRRLQTSQDSIVFARERGITEEQITHVIVNSYEYQLHTEFLTHIHSVCALQEKYSIDNQNIFIDALGSGIELGMKSNHLHNPEPATRWSDFCYEAKEIIQGIGEGIMLGSYNTVDMVMHPVRILVRMVDGVRMLGSLTARTVGTLAHWNYLIECGECLQCVTEMAAIGEQLATMAASIKEATSQMSNREVVKHVTAFGTEWVLTGQMFAMGHTLCSNLGNTIKRTIKFLKDEDTAREFALATTNGVLVKASENMNKSGGSVRNLVTNTSELLGTAIAEYTASLQAELEIIRKALDNKVRGFLECANKYLKPEYEHILGINPIYGRNGISKIGGFHHDSMHAFRKSGILEFVDLAKTESGFYKADIFASGRYVDTKTFFPAHWTRTQVMEKILETCESFIKSGLQPTLTKDGKYLIKHMIENGVEIEIYITKSGHIKTAYPVLK